MKIHIARIYDDKQPAGYRVLVDRLWPRGITKERARLDEWNKDIAPDTKLRKWFNHEDTKWMEFRKKYRAELQQNKNIAQDLLARTKNRKSLVLLYGAKSPTQNHAVILQEFLDEL